ncbi:hypothetical protein AGLY_015550 [Aphis glycines]|uniref:THAP-type domain-containing protein n=1 Tax=Aphis glycines TaxID=307491 RepID=A0A6G0T0H1_APHGL|nr:hypothetical protein AGLY_015550 [Aphis glycines]
MSRKSGYSFKCIIKLCGEMKTQKDSISFFSFPKDPARCEIWLERCQLPADTLSQKNVKLCGKHFEKIMFLNFLENRLKPDAIPTLFPDNCDVSITDLSSEKVRTCTSSSNTVSCGSNTPLNISDDPGSSKSCTTVAYDNNEILALPLPGSPVVPNSINYAISPGTSSFSSEKSTYLDSPSDFTSPSSSTGCQTLKSWSEKTPRKVLLRQQLKIEKEARLKAEKTILALSNQLSEFNTVENLLSLCEQHLSPAVLTIVKSNLMRKTRNPHGYRYTNDMKQLALTIYFLGQSVYRFLKSILSLPSVRTLRKVTSKYELIPGGNNVKWKQPVAYFFVSGSCRSLDLNDIIMSTIKKLLNISLNVKAFVTDQGSNFVSFSKSVYVSPQRPYFTVDGKEIVIDDELTDNKYIIQFYNVDSKLNLRLAPKLTQAHINPGPFEKMRVYLAAQVFSQSVAAGMNTHLELGKLPLEAKCTINFIDKMDKLFDIFNSCKVPNRKYYRRPFKNISMQIEHLSMMLSFLKKIKVNGTDVTSRINFINGWLISINGLLKLWILLNESTRHPGDYVLFTNRLNQDCLENLFSMFRNKNGNNRNPTPVQFYIAFRNLFCLNYFQHSPNANCIKDINDILCHINPQEVNPTNVVLPEPSSRAYTNTAQTTYGNLQMPENDFYEFIYELENIFIERFPIFAIAKGVAYKLNEFLSNLFVRFRIFSSVKFLNRELVSERQFKNTYKKLSHQDRENI